MPRVIRRLVVFAVAAIVALFVLAAVTAYWLFSGDGARLALEQQATAWLGQPVRIASARARLFPRAAVQLADVRVGEPARVTFADVQLSTNLRALLSRRLEDAALTVSDSRVEMPLPFALPTGGTTPDAGVSSGNGMVRVVSINAIALRNIRIVSRGREINVSGDAALDGTRLTVQRFTAESGRTSLDADGIVDLSPRMDAKLRVKANRLDLDEILALADAFTPAKSSAQTSQPRAAARIAARLSAETATAAGLEVRQFAGDLVVDGDDVVLAPLTFQLFGGKYQGSLNARLGNTLSATIQSRVDDIDVARVAAFGNAPDTITGRLTGAATFSGAGEDVAAVLRAARGNGTATIVNGTIRRLDLVRTIVLFFGRPAPDTAAGSDAFDRIDASFSLARQVFRADAFSMRARDADAVGSGTLDVSTKALDGVVDLSLSEELSAQAGTDLYRFTHEGKRIVLPARVGGSLAEPALTIDAAAAVGRGFRNEVDRRLKGVLEGLFGR